MTKEIKTRNFDVEILEGDDPTKIYGRAVVYDVIEHGEVFRPGSLTKTLAESIDIKAYWQHDTTRPLGRTRNGTLQLTESLSGVDAEITPNLDTDWGKSALASVKRRDVDQFSFGFIPIKTRVVDIDGEKVEEILEARLIEVSPVSQPWYTTTLAKVKSEPEPGTTHSTHKTKAASRGRELELMGLRN